MRQQSEIRQGKSSDRHVAITRAYITHRSSKCVVQSLGRGLVSGLLSEIDIGILHILANFKLVSRRCRDAVREKENKEHETSASWSEEFFEGCWIKQEVELDMGLMGCLVLLITIRWTPKSIVPEDDTGSRLSSARRRAIFSSRLCLFYLSGNVSQNGA